MRFQTPEDAVSDESTGCSVLMSEVNPSTILPPATGLSATETGAAGAGAQATATNNETANATTKRLIEPSRRPTDVFPQPSRSMAIRAMLPNGSGRRGAYQAALVRVFIA